MTNQMHMDMVRIAHVVVSQMEIKMTDATVEVAEVETEQKSELLRIPVVKAKGQYLEGDPDKLPIHVYREVVVQGWKVILNRGQTKITKAAYPNPQELQDAAMEKAIETMEAMYAGKIRIMGGGKSDKVPREVQTLARQMAKAIVKQQIKDAGMRISLFEAKDITAAANAMLQSTPELVEAARVELDRRNAIKVKGFDISAMKVSKKKEQEAERKKAEKILSAAKTGQVASRGRPVGRPQ
jgi:hypothetical protein